jgi:hypothetical protein
MRRGGVPTHLRTAIDPELATSLADLVAGLSFGGDAEASRSHPARVSRLRDKATAIGQGIIPADLANVPGRSRGSRRAFAESEHAEHRHDKADDQDGGRQRGQVLVGATIDVEQQVEIFRLQLTCDQRHVH